MKSILKACKDQGIVREQTNGGHYRFFRTTEPKKVVIVSQTSSDFRAEQKIIRDLRNILGFEWPWDKRAARREAKAARDQVIRRHERLIEQPPIDLVPRATFAESTTIKIEALKKEASPMPTEPTSEPKDSPLDVNIGMIDQVLRAMQIDDNKPTLLFSVDARDNIVCRLRMGPKDDTQGCTASTAALAMRPCVLELRNQLIREHEARLKTLKQLGVML